MEVCNELKAGLAPSLENGWVLFAVCAIKLTYRLEYSVGKFLLNVRQKEKCLHKGVEIARVTDVFKSDWYLFDPTAMVSCDGLSL